jgi:hypothetical protein
MSYRPRIEALIAKEMKRRLEAEKAIAEEANVQNARNDEERLDAIRTAVKRVRHRMNIGKDA